MQILPMSPTVLAGIREPKNKRVSSSLVGMHKTGQFLGPGININQDETSEESEIKENLIHLMKHFGVLGRMTQLLRHRQNVSFFPLLEL